MLLEEWVSRIVVLLNTKIARMRSVVLVLCLMVGVSQTWAKSTEIGDENEVESPADQEDEGGYERVQKDPCYNHPCGVGHECDLDDNNVPVCICAHQCTPEVEDRAKVCSTTNVTFDSECDMFRQKCLCSRTGRRGCDNREHENLELDYYGPCKAFGECGEFEMAEYPRRMREWLYLIMEELDSRKELSQKASKMAKKALQMEKKWVIPVIWKFCDLDVTPDEEIDFHELIPISAPLKPLETCTTGFLSSCDENNDGLISKWEWGRCLGLEKEEMDERCEEFLGEEE